MRETISGSTPVVDILARLLSDATVVQAILAFAGVLVVTGGGIITLLIQQRKRRLGDSANTAKVLVGVEEVRQQVTNTHTSNLREDLDEKFGHVVKSIESVIKRLDTHSDHVSREFATLRNDFTQLRGDLEEERRRVRTLEDTVPRRRPPA